ncbi:MAG: hypothetical protein ACE5NA_12930, partial [Nitrospiraceae bacterium]
ISPQGTQEHPNDKTVLDEFHPVWQGFVIAFCTCAIGGQDSSPNHEMKSRTVTVQSKWITNGNCG